MRATLASIDGDVTRSSCSADLTPHLADFKIAGAAAHLDRALHALDPLIARTRIAGDARGRRHGELVINRDIAFQLGIINAANVNNVSVLLDRRVLLDALHFVVRRQSSATEPVGEFAGAHNAVHLYLIAGTGLN